MPLLTDEYTYSRSKTFTKWCIGEMYIDLHVEHHIKILQIA